MRNAPIDRAGCSCLKGLLARTREAPAERRLAILKQAVVEHSGCWDLPSDVPGIYQPVLMSIQIFGVYAMAESLEQLPGNWMRAAGNILGHPGREFTEVA